MTLLRPSFDVYYLRIAQSVSLRATCKRLAVGAILVVNNNILSSGYNGAPSKQPCCLDVDCLMEGASCVRSVHAELNTIVFAAKHGAAIDGATLYSTHSPCYYCSKFIVNAGIKRVVFHEEYRYDERVPKLFRDAGIVYERISVPPFQVDVVKA